MSVIDRAILISLFVLSYSVNTNPDSKIFWECQERSALYSFIKADLVVAATIDSFYFKGEDLYFSIEVLNKYKGNANVKSFKFIHPTARLDYLSGINWMGNMIGRNYIIYLNFVNNEYIIGVCSRLIENDSKNISKELEFLAGLESKNYDKLWIDNSELSEENRVKPMTNIDSLIAEEKVDFNSLKGYPIIVTQFIIDKYGRMVATTNPSIQLLTVTNFNNLVLSPFENDKINMTEKQLILNEISSKINLWKPAELKGHRFNSIVKIKWMVIDDKLTYRIL